MVWNIENHVYRRRPIGQEIQGFDVPEGTMFYSFHVTDPQSRYLPAPWASDKPGPWIEAIPLCLTVYCTEDTLKSYTEYFNSYDCRVGDLVTSQMVYSYQCVKDTMPSDMLQNLFQRLIQGEQYVTQQCSWLVQSLPSCHDKNLVNGSGTIPRAFDALYDFQNVQSLLCFGVIVSPDQFTADNPLLLSCVCEVIVTAKDPNVPIFMTGILYNAELRRNNDDKAYTWYNSLINSG